MGQWSPAIIRSQGLTLAGLLSVLWPGDVTRPTSAAHPDAAASSTSNVTVTPAGIACGGSDFSTLKSFVYVNPNGADSSSCGSAPQASSACQTIAQGLANCKVPGCGVLVAWGKYSLRGVLQLRNGVNLYGGCLPAVQANPAYRSSLYAVAGGAPAIEGNLVNGVTIESFKLFGSNNSGHGPSVAVQLFGGSGSYGVTINNSIIYAGNGGPGLHGGGGGNGSENDDKAAICGVGGAADPNYLGIFSQHSLAWTGTVAGSGASGSAGPPKAGSGGGGGTMGGASIGVLALWSFVTLNNTRVVGGVGGPGGQGGIGGTTGYAPGPQGGAAGGAGAGGAGGNGGPAIGVALASATASGSGSYYYPGVGGAAGAPNYGGLGACGENCVYPYNKGCAEWGQPGVPGLVAPYTARLPFSQ